MHSKALKYIVRIHGLILVIKRNYYLLLFSLYSYRQYIVYQDSISDLRYSLSHIY